MRSRLVSSDKDLSTPSLGITNRAERKDFLRNPPICFQLPLSGSRERRELRGRNREISHAFNSLSRDHENRTLVPGRAAIRRARHDFQLPLSGSLLPRSIASFARSLTFNSLSRDHARASGYRLPNRYFLSTPSLGITREQK